jgi:hypothetical protein
MDFGHFLEKYFSIIFWARRRKAVRQGFGPELFMTDISCHQLGAKPRLFILTFRPGSANQHQKIKFSCRCGERVRLKMTLPTVFSGFFFTRNKTISGKTRPLKRVICMSFLIIFVQVSQCIFLWSVNLNRCFP